MRALPGKKNKKLLLIFHIGEKKYAIDATNIKEIIPMVRIESISNDNRYIAGHINYRGKMIPVVDIAMMQTGKPSAKLLSTRIIVMYNEKYDDFFGLIAEKVTETRHIDSDEISHPFMEEDQKLIDGILHGKEEIIRNLRYDNLFDSINKKFPESKDTENVI